MAHALGLNKSSKQRLNREKIIDILKKKSKFINMSFGCQHPEFHCLVVVVKGSW